MRPPGGVFWGQCCGNATEVPPGRRQTPSGGHFSSPFLNFRPPAAAFRRRQNRAAGNRPPAFRPASAASAKPSGPIRGGPAASPGPFTAGGRPHSLPDRPPSPAGARAAAGSALAPQRGRRRGHAGGSTSARSGCHGGAGIIAGLMSSRSGASKRPLRPRRRLGPSGIAVRGGPDVIAAQASLRARAGGAA